VSTIYAQWALKDPHIGSLHLPVAGAGLLKRRHLKHVLVTLVDKLTRFA
jgi:hypothetical protein